MTPEDYISISHWGMFKRPSSENQKVMQAKTRIEKLLHPIMSQIVDMRA